MAFVPGLVAVADRGASRLTRVGTGSDLIKGKKRRFLHAFGVC